MRSIIAQMVENALKELTMVVSEKVNILESDKIEVERQLVELKV